jgi:hypothetical protein
MSLMVALGVGLLIGLDREKHKSAGTASQSAGVRTFTLVALLGAMAALLHSDVMLGIAGAGVVMLNALSYRANQVQYPGLTTEFALIAAFAIGFMAVGQVELAAALGVLVTLLISSKSRLHTFAVSQLSEQELHDATLLAGAALIVLPLLPDRPIDPFGVVNLRVVWRLTILMLSVNALGYIARRMLGPQVALAVAGFCGGLDAVWRPSLCRSDLPEPPGNDPRALVAVVLCALGANPTHTAPDRRDGFLGCL